MKKIIALILVLILALSLSACSFEFGGGTSGGDPANSKPTFGTTDSSGDTSGPTQPTDTSKPTDSPGGLIDSRLVGTWMYHTTSVTHHLQFNADGTYSYNMQIGNGVRKFIGNYSTENGRIYFSDTKNTENGTIIQPYNLEYLFGNKDRHVATDNPSGEYLNMYRLPTGAFGTEGNPPSAEEFIQQSYPMNEYRRTGK